jgi:hypothetical protein
MAPYRIGEGRYINGGYQPSAVLLGRLAGPRRLASRHLAG